MVPAEWMTTPTAWAVGGWPTNVWIGCTVEDQQRAVERLPHLLALPAPRRFVSYEPALGPVDWTHVELYKRTHPFDPQCVLNALTGHVAGPGDVLSHIDWLIIGGESGPRARPFRVEWARDTIRQCKAARVAVWMKQMGDEAVGQWMPPLKLDPDGRAPLGSFQSCQFKPARDGAGLAYRFHAHHGTDPDEWPDDLRVQERPAPALPA